MLPISVYQSVQHSSMQEWFRIPRSQGWQSCGRRWKSVESESQWKAKVLTTLGLLLGSLLTLGMLGRWALLNLRMIYLHWNHLTGYEIGESLSIIKFSHDQAQSKIEIINSLVTLAIPNSPSQITQSHIPISHNLTTSPISPSHISHDRNHLRHPQT